VVLGVGAIYTPRPGRRELPGRIAPGAGRPAGHRRGVTRRTGGVSRPDSSSTQMTPTAQEAPQDENRILFSFASNWRGSERTSKPLKWRGPGVSSGTFVCTKCTLMRILHSRCCGAPRHPSLGFGQRPPLPGGWSHGRCNLHTGSAGKKPGKVNLGRIQASGCTVRFYDHDQESPDDTSPGV